MKQFKFGLDAKESLLRGIQILADAVGTTLGPLGNNVALDKKWAVPQIIHDGVSVAKDINLPDPFENMGAQLVKEAASKTNDDAGDGTTTATVFSRWLVEEGIRRIKENEGIIGKGLKPMRLRREILNASKYVIDFIKSNAKKLTTKEEITQIATISAQDEEIGRIVGETIWEAGTNGVVNVEDGSGMEIETSFTEGMEFDRGYSSPYFATDGEKMETNLKDPYILITDNVLSIDRQLTHVLEEVVKRKGNLVIISPLIEGSALQLLVLNRIKGNYGLLAVRAPSFGERQLEILEDIAILTGGRFINEASGLTLDSITIEDLGRARLVWSSKDSTKIIDGKGDKKEIEKRVKHIKNLIDSTSNEYEKLSLQERHAKLAGGVAVISVGAKTEVELKEKKERVIDAVSATKAALTEGIVPGGATMLLKSIKLIKDDTEGAEILKFSLKKPFELLLENAGLSPTDYIDRIMKDETGIGVDVMDGELKNMVDVGIIEPAAVVISAVDNATRVAGTVLTTDVLVTDIPEDKK